MTPVDRLLGKDVTENVNTTAMQEVFAESEEKGLRFMNSLGQTLGNMIPALTVGGVLGQGVMFMSSAGGAYREAKETDASELQCVTYALLSGASEVGLQKALGGIARLGSKGNVGKVVSEAVKRLSSKVSNQKLLATLIGAGNFVGDMAGEALEEYLQTIITPVLQNTFLDADNKITLASPEQLEAALSGALFSAVFNGISLAGGANSSVKEAREMQGANIRKEMGGTESVIGASMAFDENTMAYKNAQKLAQKAAKKGIDKITDTDLYWQGAYINDAINNLKKSSTVQNTVELTEQDINYGKNLISLSANFSIENPIQANINLSLFSKMSKGPITVTTQSGDVKITPQSIDGVLSNNSSVEDIAVVRKIDEIAKSANLNPNTGEYEVNVTNGNIVKTVSFTVDNTGTMTNLSIDGEIDKLISNSKHQRDNLVSMPKKISDDSPNSTKLEAAFTTSLKSDSTVNALLDNHNIGFPIEGSTEIIGVHEEQDAREFYEAINNTKRNENLDIGKLTQTDVESLLENCVYGEYANDDYIPVSIKTPNIIIESLKKYIPLDDRPMIMNVGKVRQDMETADIDDGGSRLHGLDSDDMIAIFRGMFTPEYVVYQSDNDRGCAIVKIKTNKGKIAMAIIDFGSNKNPKHMNGYAGGKYNVIVTTYIPDSIESYLSKEENVIVYDKKKDSSRRSSGSLVPSLSNESPFFDDSISQYNKDINNNQQNSHENISTESVLTFETQQQAPASMPTSTAQQTQPAAPAPQEASTETEAVRAVTPFTARDYTNAEARKGYIDGFTEKLAEILGVSKNSLLNKYEGAISKLAEDMEISSELPVKEIDALTSQLIGAVNFARKKAMDSAVKKIKEDSATLYRQMQNYARATKNETARQLAMSAAGNLSVEEIDNLYKRQNELDMKKMRRQKEDVERRKSFGLTS